MPYRFTSSFPYLLNRVGVRMGELFSKRLSEYGLTVPMYRVLAVLSQEGPQRLSDLSEMISVELSTLSRLVSTMKTRELISRTRPEGDGRTVRIELMEDGRALVDVLMPIASNFEQIATGSFDDKETEWLKTALVQIHQNLETLDTKDS